ncbi:hypothetical protein [Saccharothrix sp.]|uniref:hypothetical protein n=1 Tax=Saccharothrix sp. TaxID=1873460 RepID=UPI002811631C|nr:hypothetical protein [Saccharothrix sp.]
MVNRMQGSRQRRRTPWRHDHRPLARALDKTFDVPLLQGQVMQIVIDAAGFSAGEVVKLRRAVGAKRALSKMDPLNRRCVPPWPP